MADSPVSSVQTDAVLARFSPSTRAWFEGAFDAPTAAQVGAWDAISTGQHALVVAPTGSGKTLAAFLWALDGFLRDADQPAAGEQPRRGTRVLYISPLKALGVDVERNLRAPLIGISQTALRAGVTVPEVSVGVRSGDTSARDRRRLVSTPPDILITTPESLYLMLTSQARSTLAGVETVIIDEVHAVAGDKRGAHLALSLERLDALLAETGRRVQRIGLSATVSPTEEVARFVGGVQPVTVVDPGSAKSWDLTVSVPVEDMTDLPGAAGAGSGAAVGPGFGESGSGPGLQPHASLWPHVEERIVDVVAENRSTIVFANSRRLAERLTGRLNEIWSERQLGAADSGAETGTDTAEIEFARAHHGSVSKEQRALVEDALKSGRLRCVVATSSLELGIDMGAVDVVVQVEAPPSVASGLQRVGRAGHQVGETSVGWFFPKQRGDLVTTAVVTERMRAGQIETLRVPTNPLDVLAQQTVAAVALDEVDAESWFDLVRRAAPFTTLPHSVFESVLDLLAGRYPSDEFAELKPRVVWDREAGTLTGRPGAQRLAVTSGGTIPDRGLFGVFLAGSENEGSGSGSAGTARTGGRRVGELDEEMVYESRVGDVIILGATSWQIQDITHDRVLVVPAFGQPGRLPFWRGDAEGRPLELGRALGAFRREVHGTADAGSVDSEGRAEPRARLSAAGLDAWASDNLLNYLRAQAEATGQLPTERTLVVERFQDELGDWRVVLHSPFGMSVHAPWALAVGARLRARYGMDGQAMAADDGIVLRVPLMDDEPPGAELFTFETDELDELVRTEVGSSALFAARFRENAARALLLPRRDPGKRTPLWQQRQRSAQLLEVARKHPRFPIILETVRECLQDVYNLPGLTEVMQQLSAKSVRLVETTTPTPSPFAQSLLFGYTAQFMYEGDSPLAERRAAALSLDPGLLADLLGTAELRDLLDPQVIADVEAQLQRRSPAHRAHGMEGAADLLRLLGPLSAEGLAERLTGDDESSAGATEESAEPTESTASVATARAHAESLVHSNRAFSMRIGGETVFAAVEDAARLRDALGVPLPVGIPTVFIEPVADPLADVVARYARTHGPFTAAEAGAAVGLAPAVVFQTLQRLAADQRVSSGAFRPRPVVENDPARHDAGPWQQEWCDTEVLRRIRRRSLAALRAEVEPVEQATYTRFLLDWQGIQPRRSTGAAPTTAGPEALDQLASALDQLAGYPAPASAWESSLLPARVPGYTPALLDQLLSTGEFLWTGTADAPGQDGWLAFHPADAADLTVAEPADDDASAFTWTSAHRALLSVLRGTGAWFFPALAEQVRLQHPEAETTQTQLADALWDLVWAGHLTNDTFAPLRGLLGQGTTAHRTPTPRNRARAGRPSRGQRLARLQRLDGSSASLSGPPEPTGTLGPAGATELGALSPLSARDQARTAGRWSLAPAPADGAGATTLRAHTQAEALLDRYGVITRGSVQAEQLPGGFATQYRLLTRMEEAGQVRRGYFIDRLGAAQFSTAATVDRLRGFTASEQSSTRRSAPVAVALAATDPANPYGAALPWPDTAASAAGNSGTSGTTGISGTSGRHRPGRKAGAMVVLVDGELVLYLERGGRSVLNFIDDACAPHDASAPDDDAADTLRAAARALHAALTAARVPRLSTERVNGEPVLGTPLAAALIEAGFYSSPSGVRFRS
ncbi:ATP-dependent helicase [Citricoccus sp. NR2]|uniref:ATP-dependent helicase n=1 Tax=Citricoccus sp. NR2 TaxID=3004095 RepID=UPI0022DE4A98|nr:ATP-dependent helicase [Citricoccus sp. NR2]WBL19240.1 ATP-dependent helicase [Citricoccus sp. NR2]